MENDLSIDTAFGVRIKQARESKSYSVAEMARRMVVTEKTVKKWESGKSKPRANKLQMLSGLLNVPLLWLIDGDEQFGQIEQGPSRLEKLEQKSERVVVLQQELTRLNSEIASEIEVLRKLDDEPTSLAS